jgi:hypothetical protein
MWDEDDFLMDGMMSSDDGPRRSLSVFDDDDDYETERLMADEGSDREGGGCLSLLLGYCIWKWLFK